MVRGSLGMKINMISKICMVSCLFFSTSLYSLSFSETIDLLKQAFTAGETLPLSELPFFDDVSLPGPIKDALSKIELTGPTITMSGESAILTAGASFFGVPVKVQLRLGLNLGSAARPAFVSRVQDKKTGAKTPAQAAAEEQAALQKVGKLVKQETEQVEVVPGSLLATNPENTASQAGSVEQQEGNTGLAGAKIPTAILQEMAPQAAVNVPVQDTKQVANETSQVDKKIADLEPEKDKKEPSKVKAKLSGAAKGALKLLKYSIFIGIPKLDFAAIDSRLAFLNLIQFSKLAFVITNDDHTDTDWNRTFYSGFNILGTARLTGPLDKIAGTIGTNLTEVALQGVIKEEVFGSFLLAQLPGKLKLGEGLETSGLILRVQLVQAAVPLSISILTGLNVSVPNQSTPLGFRAGLTYLLPTEFVLGGWMEGMWKNPFGLPYFSIGELGIQAGMDLTTAAASLGILSISRIGMRGKMGFSDKTVEMASSISLSSSSPDIMLYGKFTGGITLNDVITVGATVIEESAKQVGESVSIKDKVKGKLPNLGIKEAEILLAPKDVPLAGRYYSQGVTVGGAVEILGVTGELRVAIQKSKISGNGFLSEINAGPFKLTGAGKDEKRGTKDDGPVIHFFITKDIPFIGLYLDARAELDKKILGGAYGDVHVDLSLKGVDFDLKTKLFNEFATNLKISGETLKPKDWKVIGTFEQEALTHLEGLLQKAIEEIAKSADRDIAKAQKDVDNARAKLKSLDPDKKALDEQISKCKGQKTVKAAPLQAQVQSAIDKKIKSVQGPELSAQDVKKQIDALRAQGVSQKQLDLVAQNMWARIAQRDMDTSLSVMQVFKSSPELIKDLDPTTQAAVKESISQTDSTSWSSIVKVMEGQIEWTLSKLRSAGMPAQFVDPVREIIWRDEAKNRYFKKYENAIFKNPSIGGQEAALRQYSLDIRRFESRKLGLTPQTMEIRIDYVRTLLREAIKASELLHKKIGFGNDAAINKYINDQTIVTMRKELESLLAGQKK